MTCEPARLPVLIEPDHIELSINAWKSTRSVWYVNSPVTRRIEPDPERAPIITKLFEWYAIGNHEKGSGGGPHQPRKWQAASSFKDPPAAPEPDLLRRFHVARTNVRRPARAADRS
jgi:hypothetical protein